MKILAGFALVKIVAMTSGPTGLAQLGQFQNLVGILTILSGGMFYTGVTKLVSEHGETFEKLLAIAHTVLKASVVGALIIGSLLFLFRDYFLEFFLKDIYLDWIFPALPLLIFLSVLNGLWLALLNGLRRIRELVLANILASVLTLIFVFLLAPRFGQKGIFISILLPPAIVIMIAFLTRFQRHHWTGIFKKSLVFKPPYGELIRFAIMGLVSAASAPIAQIIMREYLTETLSIADAGIWQGISRISEVYLLFITSSLSVYYLPKLAKTTDAASLKILTNSVLRLIIPVAVVLGLSIYILRDNLIWLLFTHEFNSMRDLFLWQILGDLVKIVSWVFAFIILARGMVIQFIIGELLFNATYILIGMLIIPDSGLIGAVYAYGINYILYLLYVVIVVRVFAYRT
jgi:O-antigen/teichoic acid export membrane protein